MAVPFYDYVKDRDALDRWANSKGRDGLNAYRLEKNAQSMDRLEGYKQSPS
jgi:hypothetical protein